MVLLEKQWITVQQKTFTKWMNSKLKVREVGVEDLVKDLSDGVYISSLPCIAIANTLCR